MSISQDITKQTGKAGLSVTEWEKAVQVMTRVPKDANDMMNVGRLQGFDVSALMNVGRLQGFDVRVVYVCACALVLVCAYM